MPTVRHLHANRALTCLENVFHRSGKGLSADFWVMVIEVPDTLVVEETMLGTLFTNWFDSQQYDSYHRIGREWLLNGQSAVLKGPSAIIPNEWICLFNPGHPEFYQIKLLNIEPFAFDPRIEHKTTRAA